MLTRAQVENGLARALGVVPDSYDLDVREGERVHLLFVRRSPGCVRSIVGLVVHVEDRGWRKVVTVRHGDRVESVELFENGPPAWGCVQCRRVLRVPRNPYGTALAEARRRFQEEEDK